jgi:AraC-like DNA-binding protein
METQRLVCELVGGSGSFREFVTVFEQLTGISLSIEAPAADLAIRSREQALFGHLVTNQLCRPTKINLNHLEEEPALITWAPGIREAVVGLHIDGEVTALLRSGCILETELPPVYLALEGCRPAPRLNRLQLRALCKMLALFAVYLGRCANQLLVQQSACEPAIVGRARDFISMHHRENIGLADVAANANVSTFYLCKLFKRITGLTVANYLLRIRIESAKELLLDRSRSVSESALEAGFQSLTHFNRAFKRIVGCSPSEFRKPKVSFGADWDNHGLSSNNDSGAR